MSEAKKLGRPKMWDEPEKFSYKGPPELREKIDFKVRSLRARGIKVSASVIQRILVEKNIDDVERFFSQELITR